MPDKADKRADLQVPGGEKKDRGAGAAGGARTGGLLSRTPVVIGGVMLVEAAVLFMGFKFLGAGPAHSAGAELALDPPPRGNSAHVDGHSRPSHAPTAAERKNFIELQVLEFRAPNKQSGRTFLYDVSIYLVTRAEREEHVKQTIAARKALITDRVRTIIAQSDPEKLGGGSEPGLETLRRQVKYQLDEIVGEGVIEEVLVPRCIPFRTDY